MCADEVNAFKQRIFIGEVLNGGVAAARIGKAGRATRHHFGGDIHIIKAKCRGEIDRLNMRV